MPENPLLKVPPGTIRRTNRSPCARRSDAAVATPRASRRRRNDRRKSAMADNHRIFGFTDEQLGTLELSWRPGLFDGQVIRVSGAGTGLGGAIAYQFGRLGAKMVICGRKPEPLERTAQGLGKLGIDCLVHPMTIRDPEQVDALFEAAWSRYGRLDVVV